MPKRTWTDEQLRAAVATATSFRQVLRAMCLPAGSHREIKQHVEALGIATSHFESHPKVRLCSDDKLRCLVGSASSASDVLRSLAIELHSNNFVKLKRQIRALGLDTSHFHRERASENRRRTQWTDDELRTAVASSFGYAETVRKLGLVPAGGNYVQVQRRIRELDLDVSHFRGRGWNVEGKYIRPIARPLEDVLVAGRPTGSHKLKRRLIRAGLKPQACELCGWAARAPDGRIPLELDHINGDSSDNRLENLRVLCPNCHSLQPTHRGLNKQHLRKKV